MFFIKNKVCVVNVISNVDLKYINYLCNSFKLHYVRNRSVFHLNIAKHVSYKDNTLSYYSLLYFELPIIIKKG